MPKKPPKPVEIPKVVPLTEQKRQVIAADQKSQRVIIRIGQQRIAFDLHTRVTRLPPHTGDQPAPVLPMRKKGGDQEKRPKRPRSEWGAQKEKCRLEGSG
jgi:hypothetical protein